MIQLVLVIEFNFMNPIASPCVYCYISPIYDQKTCWVCAVKEILKLCPEKTLVTLYKVPSFDSVDDFLQKVATVRGRLKKGGIVDVDAAARIILRDWNEGMCYWVFTVPSYPKLN